MWGKSDKTVVPQSTPTTTVTTNAAEVTDEATVTQPTEGQTSTATEEQSATIQNTATESTQTTVSPTTHKDYYAYYVVMGVFSTEQNAERAVEQARSKLSNATCAILPFKDSKFMVTVFGSDNQADCTEFARANRDAISDLWVYNKK